MNPRHSRPAVAQHTLCIVTASCVCPHLFSRAVPCNGVEGWGWWEPIQNVVSAGKPSAPPQPVAALRLCPQCAPVPRRAPRGRRDEDRCRQHRHGLRSEHGEWPRYWPGRRAYADEKWTGPRALCVWLAVTSPGPRDPSPSALPTLAHTPSGPGLYVQHTHGLLRVLRRKRARHYLGKDGWLWRRRSGWGGVSGTFAGFPWVLRGAGHHLPAAGWRAPAGPRTVVRSHLLASRDPRSGQARPPPRARRQAPEHKHEVSKCPLPFRALAYGVAGATGWDHGPCWLAYTKVLKPASGERLALFPRGGWWICLAASWEFKLQSNGSSFALFCLRHRSMRRKAWWSVTVEKGEQGRGR